jgi:thiol-disulfide isomerase/thioredoxin
MKFLFAIILLFVAASCGESNDAEEANKPKDNFSVSGKIQGAEGMTIYLEALSQQGTIEVAKATISENGAFRMKGNVPGLGIYQLRLGESSDKMIPFTLSPKEHVQLRTTFGEFTTRPNVSGTEWAKPLNTYMGLYAELMVAQQKLEAQKANLSEEEMMKIFSAEKIPVDTWALKQMTKDPDNPFNIVLSTSASPTLGFDKWDPASLDVLKTVAEAFKKRFGDSPMALTMENQVVQIEQAYTEYQTTQEGGLTAPEIELKDPNGKLLKLSSLRGKVVLIDFWASWCRPCRAENPNVVRLYKQFKDKGFTVFSVSLDEDAVAWKKAIAQDGLIWPTHVSDLLGWSTPVIQLYKFDGIPYTVLIDREGKVIATGLRGMELEQKLKETLAK